MVDGLDRAAVLQQQRHQDRAVARHCISLRADPLGVEKDFHHGSEPPALAANELAAKADLVALAVVLDRIGLERAAVGEAMAGGHLGSPFASSSNIAAWQQSCAYGSLGS